MDLSPSNPVDIEPVSVEPVDTNPADTFFEEFVAPSVAAQERHFKDCVDPFSMAPGDWIECTIIGEKRSVRYVKCNHRADRHIDLGDPQQNGCTRSVSYKMLRAARVKRLGHTAQRWWWKYVPWRRSICPFQKLDTRTVAK